jgi:hypothetical protein
LFTLHGVFQRLHQAIEVAQFPPQKIHCLVHNQCPVMTLTQIRPRCRVA